MDFPVLPSVMFDRSWVGLASLIVAVILPFLAALLVRVSWSVQKKGLVLLALSAVKTFIDMFIAVKGVDFDVVGAVWTVGINFGIAVIMYFGFFRDGALITKLQTDYGLKDRPRL